MDLRDVLIGHVAKHATDFDPLSSKAKEKRQTDLAKPLEWPEAVTRVLCTNCGEISEINEEAARKLFGFLDLLGSRPEIALNRDYLKNWHFEINYCRECQRWGKKKQRKGEVRLVRNKTGG